MNRWPNLPTARARRRERLADGAVASPARASTRSQARSNDLLPLDLGGADDVAVKRGLGIELAREFLGSGEFDLHERCFQALAHSFIGAGGLQLLRQPR